MFRMETMGENTLVVYEQFNVMQKVFISNPVFQPLMKCFWRDPTVHVLLVCVLCVRNRWKDACTLSVWIKQTGRLLTFFYKQICYFFVWLHDDGSGLMVHRWSIWGKCTCERLKLQMCDSFHVHFFIALKLDEFFCDGECFVCLFFLCTCLA